MPEHQLHSEPFRRMLLTARIERLKAIKANIDTAQEHRAALSQVVSRVTEFACAVPSERALMVSGSFDEILSRLQSFNRELSEVVQALDHAAISDDVSLRSVPNILTAAGQCRSAMEAVRSHLRVTRAHWRRVSWRGFRH